MDPFRFQLNDNILNYILPLTMSVFIESTYYTLFTTFPLQAFAQSHGCVEMPLLLTAFFSCNCFLAANSAVFFSSDPSSDTQVKFLFALNASALKRIKSSER